MRGGAAWRGSLLVSTASNSRGVTPGLWRVNPPGTPVEAPAKDAEVNEVKEGVETEPKEPEVEAPAKDADVNDVNRYRCFNDGSPNMLHGFGIRGGRHGLASDVEANAQAVRNLTGRDEQICYFSWVRAKL